MSDQQTELDRIMAEEYEPEKHISLEALAARVGSDTAMEEMNNVTYLTREGLDLLQVEKQMRMKRVLESMDPGEVALLMERFVERRPLRDIAEDRGVTRQAISLRLVTARNNFKRQFALLWNLPLPALDPEEEE